MDKDNTFDENDEPINEYDEGMQGYEGSDGEDPEGAAGSDGQPGFPVVTPLQGMYRDWFLDYASYVILERAVPHINDGLKPVQRRILHSMKRLDDGRYNKVANIIGHTMQFHPHGDASIGDAQIGRASCRERV